MNLNFTHLYRSNISLAFLNFEAAKCLRLHQKSHDTMRFHELRQAWLLSANFVNGAVGQDGKY